MNNNNKWLIYLITKHGKTEFDIIVSLKDKVQDLNINQLELEVHDTS